MPKKVFVSGCYDLLHSGHVEFFRQAAQYGDLYVGIGSDATIQEYKHHRTVYSEQERLFMVKSIRYVKDAFINAGNGIMDFVPTVEALRPDILVVNSDGGNDDKCRFCEEHGIQYVVLERTPHVVADPSTGSGTALIARSSTDLKKTESQIPTRLDLAGTWIDQPYVSQYAPGWAITISLEPTFEIRERCGLSTSTRNMIRKIWPYSLPNMDPEMLAKLVFCFENDPERSDGIPVVEDAAEGFGSRYRGRVLGTFGRYGVLSFNGNKMIATSGGGALITGSDDEWREIMMYATQYRESYPYYQHEKIGFNYRMSNICAGIGRGQMTVAAQHIAHHKHVQRLYEELLADVPGITVHSQPATGEYDSNYWLCTITLDENLKVKGQENAYKTIVQGAVGGAAGVIHMAKGATTDCQPNDNVEALRVGLDAMNIEARPVWKPMHRQPCYKGVPCYLNGVSEAIFKVGMCLPAGSYVKDEDVKYIVDCIKDLIES